MEIKGKFSKSNDFVRVHKFKNKDISELKFNKSKGNEAIDKIGNKKMFGYKIGKLPFYLTGEILLKPKESVGINEIIFYAKNGITIKKQTKYNTFVLDVENWQEIFNLSNSIYESGLVEYCHPNFITEIVKTETDPLFGKQFYLNNIGQFGGTYGLDINYHNAMDDISSTCNHITRIAVIDDGIEAHEDLGNRVLNGFTPTDPNGFGATNTDVLPATSLEHTFGHGQCCAGIIAASHNTIGIAGISPNSSLIPINIFNDWFVAFDNIGRSFISFREDPADIEAAIDFAWDNANAEVISNSWGYNTTDPDLIPNADAIIFAINRAATQGRNNLGSIIVFSSGNSAEIFNGVCYPANQANVIAVGAIDNLGIRCNYSSFGAELDIVSLSDNIMTIDRMGNNGYDDGNYNGSFNGTSATCPQVSGVVALILSKNPNLTRQAVTNIIESTAQKLNTYNYAATPGRTNGTWNNQTGYGLLDANAALKATPMPVTVSCSGTSGLGYTTVTTDRTISGCNISVLNASVKNGAELILDAENEVTINGDFEVELGSELNIK